MSIAIARSFYEAFKARDGDSMAALYSDNIQFSDPVFPELKAEQAKNMWRMLCGQAKDLQVEYEIILAKENKVHVAWIATYTFSKTHNLVVNHVRAELTIENSKIVSHQDSFDFWKWSRQALGPLGLFLGWTPFLKKKVQAQAATSLQIFTTQRT